MISITPIRELTLREPSRPKRPAHVSAASGLVRVADHLYVVADDENHLAVFPATGTDAGVLARIFEGDLPLGADKRKRHKRDLESLVRLPAFREHPHGALLALGSCSNPGRCIGVVTGLDAQGELDGRTRPIDLTALRGGMIARIGNLNIEGAVVLGGQLVLLHRGNKRERRNARIRLGFDAALESLTTKGSLGIEALVGIEEIDLGDSGGVPLCFTDGAALPHGRMAFTAVAEDTADSYHDGPCSAAAVGVLAANGHIDLLEPIDPCYKVEGIEATLDGDVIHALMVTDADDSTVPASLLRCEIRAGS